METGKDLQNLKIPKWTIPWCTARECGGAPLVIPLLAWRQWDVRLQDCLWESGRLRWRWYERNKFVSSKKRNWWNNFLLCCYKTNLFLSYSLTQAGGRMESTRSELVSLFNLQFCTEVGEGEPARSNTLVVNYVSYSKCALRARNAESVCNGFLWDYSGSLIALHYVSTYMSTITIAY